MQPILRGFRLECCDCGLVHRVDIRIVEEGARGRVRRRAVQFRAWRDRRATWRARRVVGGARRRQDED